MSAETIVIKIGTSSLTQPETGYLALATIANLVEALSQLRSQGYRVILVSSGYYRDWETDRKSVV